MSEISSMLWQTLIISHCVVVQRSVWKLLNWTLINYIIWGSGFNYRAKPVLLKYLFWFLYYSYQIFSSVLLFLFWFWCVGFRNLTPYFDPYTSVIQLDQYLCLPVSPTGLFIWLESLLTAALALRSQSATCHWAKPHLWWILHHRNISSNSWCCGADWPIPLCNTDQAKSWGVGGG